MISKAEIEKLAKLSRISISAEEAETLSKEMDSILQYVDEIKKITESASDITKEQVTNKNVFREDKNTHDGGLYTDSLMAAAPQSKDQYIKVKKIL